MYYARIISQDNDIHRKLSLAYPRSHCPTCKRTLKSYHLLFTLELYCFKGQMRILQLSYQRSIPCHRIYLWCINLIRYISLSIHLDGSGMLFFYLDINIPQFYRHGKKILPDFLTLLLLWSGIIFNLNTMFVSVEESVIRAIFGYLFLGAIATIFKLVSGKDGMGQGDVNYLQLLERGWVGVLFNFTCSRLMCWNIWVYSNSTKINKKPKHCIWTLFGVCRFCSTRLG